MNTSCQKYILRAKLRRMLKPWVKFLMKNYPDLPYDEILLVVKQEIKEYSNAQ